jgi:hypothetical protein
LVHLQAALLLAHAKKTREMQRKQEKCCKIDKHSKLPTLQEEATFA